MSQRILDDLLLTKDLTHYVTGGNGLMSSVYNAFNQYVNTDYILFTASSNYPSSLPISYTNNLITELYSASDGTYGYVILPITHLRKIKKVEADIKIDAKTSPSSFAVNLLRADLNATQNQILLYNSSSPQQMSDYQHFSVNVSTSSEQYEIEYGYIGITYSNSVKVSIKDLTIYYDEVSISNGGGATHIAKVTGQLKDLSSNLSDILMVSGGGGGGLIVGETIYDGADAGGISGSGSNSGNQSTGYAFGQGESGTDKSGGGGGLYGGYKSNI